MTCADHNNENRNQVPYYVYVHKMNSFIHCFWPMFYHCCCSCFALTYNQISIQCKWIGDSRQYFYFAFFIFSFRLWKKKKSFLCLWESSLPCMYGSHKNVHLYTCSKSFLVSTFFGCGMWSLCCFDWLIKWLDWQCW